MNGSGKKQLLVIGGGPGGYPAAIKAARLGADVTLVDRDGLGGTCLHRGCIPTKFMLKSARDYLTYRELAEACRERPSPPCMEDIKKKEGAVISQLAGGTASLLKQNGVRVISGTASFINPKTLRIEETGEIITPAAVIVATGSKSARLPLPGSDFPGVVDSDGLLKMKTVPASIAVVGGGYIGLEFAQIFNMLGAKVHVVELLPCVVATADEEASRAMHKILSDQGITIETEAQVREIRKDRNLLTLVYEKDGQGKEIGAEIVLLAGGRVPRTEGLGLDRAGISCGSSGNIQVNRFFETDVNGVYAVGDVTGGLMLAHKASAEGECAAVNALGTAYEAPYQAVPSVMYTFPEMATVGMTEKEAAGRYERLLVGRFPFAANGRAVLSGENRGFVKVIADAGSECIVGASIIGPEAGHLIGEIALAVEMEATLQDVAETVHAHPSFSEAVREAVMDARGEAIHIPPPRKRSQ